MQEEKNQTILCPRCHEENESGRNFCIKCGQSLPQQKLMLCQSCLKPIPQNALFCPLCGYPVKVNSLAHISTPETTDPKKIRAKQHPSYWQLTLIAILFPFIGFIVGIVNLCKGTVLERKLGEHVLATSILFTILWYLFWRIFPYLF